VFERNGFKADTNYQNLDEEQKEQWWVDKFELPSPLQKKAEYVERITRRPKIQDKINEILKGIDAVEQAIVEDKQLWNRSEEKRQIQQYMNSRGRFINKLLASSDEDPIAQYNDILENLQSVQNDIQNRPAMKNEKFINLDCSKLKSKLGDHVNEIQQMIFTNLVREAKRDLNDLLDGWVSITDQLRKPANELSTLKENKALYDQEVAKMPYYDTAREPIRIKFRFIQAREEDIQNNELTQEDKDNLNLIDERFVEFQENLDDCQKTIKRCQALLRKDVED
jgi:hypothetical protein